MKNTIPRLCPFNLTELELFYKEEYNEMSPSGFAKLLRDMQEKTNSFYKWLTDSREPDTSLWYLLVKKKNENSILIILNNDYALFIFVYHIKYNKVCFCNAS